MEKMRRVHPRSRLSEAHRVLRQISQRHPDEQPGIALVLATLAETEMQRKDMKRIVERHVGLDLFSDNG